MTVRGDRDAVVDEVRLVDDETVRFPDN